MGVVGARLGGWPIGVPTGHAMEVLLLALPTIGSALERGGSESLGSTCGLITTMPSGVVFLLEGIILPPFSFPLQLAFQVKT